MKVTTEKLRDYFSNPDSTVILSLDLSPEFLYWLASCEIYPPKGPVCKVRDITIDTVSNQVTFAIASQPQTVKKPDEKVDVE